MTRPIIKLIKKPRITEKASFNMEKNVYHFEVLPTANRTEIKKAIFLFYKVKPIKVNIINTKGKKVMFRRKAGVKPSVKKAIVYLKEGDVLNN